MECNHLWFHLSFFYINFITTKYDRNRIITIFSDFTVPGGYTFVGKTRGNIKHNNRALTSSTGREMKRRNDNGKEEVKLTHKKSCVIEADRS